MEGFPEILRIAQAVLGIGLVIFVHELGHYLAARLSGVRVDVFSLGIGPRIAAWKRGATTFQLAAFPIGGYCRMAGEERRGDGLPPRPDELSAKGVGARFFIYSGGVLMNLAFGFVVFPILFRVGVPFIVPRIGEPYPGSPAWHARLPADWDVVEVNDRPVFDFLHIPTEVALGDSRRTTLVLRDRRTLEERTYELMPTLDGGEGFPSIGVGPAMERDDEGHPVLEVEPGSPAWDAGVRPGDRLLEVRSDDPSGDPIEDLLVATSRAAPLGLRVARGAEVLELEIEPRVAPGSSPRIGISPPVRLVLDVRDSPQVRALGLRKGDRLLAAGGEPLVRSGDLRRALLAHVERGGGRLEFRVRRDGETLAPACELASAEEALRLVEDAPLVGDRESTELVVQPGEPAELAGLRTGDRVLQIDGAEVAEWQDVFELVRRAGEEARPAVFGIARPDPAGGPPFHPPAITVDPRPIASPFGLDLRQAQYLYRTESLGESARLGVYCSWKLIQDTWLTVKKMIVGDVSTKSISGIITIGNVSYEMAETGWTKLFFFLCLLSINLAIFNVLPIPVLDGGHLFFLIIEKIKGSPVSDRVLGYSQMVGVILILSLLVYVTYNDIVRVFGGS
jgi:regulator of sigma E protease